MYPTTPPHDTAMDETGKLLTNPVPPQPSLTECDTELPALPRATLPSLLGDGGMIGTSQAIVQLGELLTRIADTDATVLIEGESGTGKELVARVLHDRSRRSNGPFVAINCAALPETLLESELFGHVKGAFTNAVSDHAGLFEAASGGTLLLDEIGDLPAGMQAKLLRVLQDRCIRRIGDNHEREVDVRVIAATNQNLAQQVQAGNFREDLYYRLNVISVCVPPLRERGDDVILLSEHFIKVFSEGTERVVRGLSRGAMEALRAYSWPGNIRELENCIQRAVLLGRSDVIGLEDLPQVIQDFTAEELDASPGDGDPDALDRISVVERRHIQRVLRAVNYNKTRAAQVLGLDRRTLHRKLSRTTKPKE